MIFKYKVKYWEEYESTEKTEEGLVYGKTYGKAANNLVEEYREDCIIDVYLSEIDADNNVLSKDEVIFAIGEDK